MREAWDTIAAVLAAAGCRAVVGVPADEPALLDAAQRHPQLVALRVRDHRLGACVAAGHTLASGAPAVVALSTGPAFSTALGGLVEAASLNLPTVVVTTRVAAVELERGAFQELDQAAMSAAFAKWHVLVAEPRRVGWALRLSVRRALEGRPGVVVVELAPECLDGLAGSPLAAAPPVERAIGVPAPAQLRRAAALLREADAPVVLVGGGTRTPAARTAVMRLAASFTAAFASSASGRGTVDEQHELACGLAGLYATPPVDALLNDADVILAIGTQLEETVRTGWPALQRCRLVHVDADATAFGRAVEPEVALVGDAAATTELLTRCIGDRARPRWRERIARATREARARYAPTSFASAPVRTLFATLAATFPDAIVVQENGLHDLWGYHTPVLRGSPATTFVAPGEQTMMGFGLGAALGAARAAPRRAVVAIAGDGAAEMTLSAFASAADLRCGVLFVVLDNGGLGWPRLQRAREGASTALTDYARSRRLAAIVGELGGRASDVDSAPALERAFAHARADMARGRIGLVRIVTDDGDLPPSALRSMGDAPRA